MRPYPVLVVPQQAAAAAVAVMLAMVTPLSSILSMARATLMLQSLQVSSCVVGCEGDLAGTA